MDLDTVFGDFVKKLEVRSGFLSEDNVRFYWFVSMYEYDNDLNHFSLEEPYTEDNLSSKGHTELDLMYENNSERWCIEIKFHRNPQKGEKSQTFAVTQSAGEIFDDICRLPSWRVSSIDNKPTRYFFLYVTDDEMHRYLSAAPSLNGEYRLSLAKFYGLKERETLNCSFEKEGIPKVFFHNAIESSKNKDLKVLDVPTLVMRGTKDIVCPSNSMKRKQNEGDGENCHIRLYEVIRKN